MDNGNTIVRIITNNDPTKIGWILESDYASYFSSDEIDNIIKPYESFVKSLPGFISLTVNASNNKCTIIQTYDTPGNANVAYTQQFTKSNNSIVLSRHALIKNKIKSLNINSNTVISIV